MLRRLVLRLRDRNRLDFFSPAGHTSLRPFSAAAAAAAPKSKPLDRAALTVSYLVSSCGLSDDAARKASKRLRLRATERADAVLALLRERGFTEPQIATLVTRHPVVLAANPEETLKPKLDFFVSIGCSGPELAKLLSAADANFLCVSFSRRLIPNFNLLKTVLSTDGAVVDALQRDPRLIQYDLRLFFLRNLEALKRHGVPGPSITKFAAKYPRLLVKRSDHFERDVQVLKQMGFNPASSQFIIAMKAMSATTRSTWERKLALYKSLGWSEEEIMAAFLKQPHCMLNSDDKIKRVMDFFVGELGLHHSFLVMRPTILGFSLEKRIIPRGTIWRILVSKRLLKNASLNTLLTLAEKEFMEKYLLKYGKEVPEILEVYQGKRELTGLLKKEADAGGTEQEL